MHTDTRPIAFSYVRFSSEKQRQGSSLERQTEAAKRWADENGYVLDRSLNLHDLAVSAFRGDNTTIGKLAAFKEAVENGTIPRGSVLLVENLDRLSRQTHRKAARVLEDILEAGVDVVTLQDGKRWTLKDLDEDPLTSIMIILTFARAHEESLTKSKRVKDGWQRNTQKVMEGKRKRSGTVPSWLKLVGTLDDGHFELVPEKVKVTQELYERFASGEAVNSIATDFKRRGIKTPRGKQFRSGNIYRLVASKAPFGILEIGKGTKNERTVFDQIEGYFPRIVDAEVQRRVRMRLDGIAQKRTPLEALGKSGEFKRKRKTKGILTGVIWSPEKVGGNRAQVAKQKDDSYGYVDSITRRWVAKREVIERPFLEGWSEIVDAHYVDTSPEIDDTEHALMVAYDAVEYAKRKKSERLILAAEADVQELQEALKELRRGQALMLQEIPESLDGMEPWEANEVVRRIIERVDVVKGEDRQEQPQVGDRRVGKKVMLRVKLKNSLTVSLGDTELMFSAVSKAD